MQPLGAGDALLPAERRALCQVTEIPDGGAKGFPAPQGGFIGLMAIRQGERVFVYVNSCPHIGTPLDWTPDRFLSRDGRFIVCATHGAEFQIDNGTCLRGPCRGDRLETVPVTIEDGTIYVPHDAGL